MAEQQSLFAVCGTKNCVRPPEYAFTWPGSDEQLACAECATRAKTVAKHMGLHLQVKIWLPAAEVRRGWHKTDE